MAEAAQITHHAAERFIQRHARHMSVHEAKNFLWKASQTAVRLKEKTAAGQFQWVVEDPYCVLVIKFDTGKPICVTVLPDREMSPHEIAMAEYEEYGAGPAATPKQEAWVASIMNRKERGDAPGVRENVQKEIPKVSNLIGYTVSEHPTLGGPDKWAILEKAIGEVRGVTEDPVKSVATPFPKNEYHGLVVTPQNAALIEIAIVKQREKTRRHVISERSQRVWKLFKTVMDFLEKKAVEDPETAHFLIRMQREEKERIEWAAQMADRSSPESEVSHGGEVGLGRLEVNHAVTEGDTEVLGEVESDLRTG